MGDFFRQLSNYDFIKEWAEVLDWYFDDEKFSANYYWNGAYVGHFTRRVKNLLDIKDFTVISEEDIIKKTCRNRKKIYIAFTSNSNSEGKDFVRHIRNGIAHGNTNYTNLNNNGKQTHFIEIKDYKSNNKTQTAYIFFPIDYIVKIHKIYKEVEKSIINNRPKGRKTKKHKLIKE